MSDRPNGLLGLVVAALFLGAWSLFHGLLGVVLGVGWTALSPFVQGLVDVTMGLLLFVASAGLYARRPWARWLALVLFAGGAVVQALPALVGAMPSLLGLAVYTGAFLYLLLAPDVVEDPDDGPRRAERMDPHQLDR